MTEQTNQTKSNKPIIGLSLSLFSIFICCISAGVTQQNYESLPFQEPLWLFGQFLFCLAGLFPLAGAILGFSSLRKNEGNRSLAITSMVIGIVFFIVALLMLGYTIFFSILALAWLEAMP